MEEQKNNEEYCLVTPLGTLVTADAKGLRLIRKTIGGKIIRKPEHLRKNNK